jgi:hypothetical protein
VKRRIVAKPPLLAAIRDVQTVEISPKAALEKLYQLMKLV